MAWAEWDGWWLVVVVFCMWWLRGSWFGLVVGWGWLLFWLVVWVGWVLRVVGWGFEGMLVDGRWWLSIGWVVLGGVRVASGW